MLRYTIPFKDNQNRSYEVRVYKEGYAGAPEELRGAPSAFSVEGTDEDFAYHPVRTSSATITVLDSRVLYDMFSSNRQTVPVKLYQGTKLMWTGYASPEQFTQPYRPVKDYISIDCMSAMASLEDAKYARQTGDGLITMSALLRYLIASAKGGYEKVYIPHVYASSEVAYTSSRSVLDDITIAEENFIEMTLDEVLEYVCTFFAWSLYDYEGSLYFVDADWRGEYREYTESLSSFVVVKPNAILTKEIGFSGADNTIDIIPGYNKCTVKSINNVFDEPVREEKYSTLRVLQDYLKDLGENRYTQKTFLKAENWEVISFDANKKPITLTGLETINDDVFGAVLMREANYEVELREGVGLVLKNGSDLPWVDCVHIRGVGKDGRVVFGYSDQHTVPILRYRGGTSTWKDGALCITYQTQLRITPEMNIVYRDWMTAAKTKLMFSLRVGDSWWNGTKWQNTACKFEVAANYGEKGAKLYDWVHCQNNKTIYMPYKGLQGYIIELPRDRTLVGDIEFTLFCPGFGKFPSELIKDTFYGMVLKDLKLEYKKRDDVRDEGEDGDRIYENVVNGAFLSETDEIEFGIGSYNGDGATYSKVLLGGKFLTDNLYSAVEAKPVRPEEAYIRRVVKRYKTTHLKLTQQLKNSLDVHPFTEMSDTSMVNKKFMVSTWIRDYEQNVLTLTMIDNG